MPQLRTPAQPDTQPNALYNELALRVMGVQVAGVRVKSVEAAGHVHPDDGHQQTADHSDGDHSVGDGSGHVVIGFVDYGFDLLHPCLLDASGSRSRFKFLWDQNCTPELVRQPQLPLSAIYDYAAADINKLIASAQQTGDRSALDAIYDPHANYYGRFGVGPGAHGTQMASIAAGSMSRGFRSPAPFADLIGVQLAVADTDWREETAAGEPTWRGAEAVETNWAGWRTYDSCPQIVHAIHYIYDRASQLGADLVIINLSIGTWAGAHDGQSPVEQAIAKVIAYGRRPGATACQVVVGAGNAGADEGHFAATLGPSETTTFQWLMNGHDRTQNKLEIWYNCQSGTPSTTEPLKIELTAPLLGSCPLIISPGRTHNIVFDGNRVGIADHVIGARGTLSRLRILLHPPYMTGAGSLRSEPLGWTITATCADLATSAPKAGSSPGKADAEPSGPVELHAWVERDDGLSERSWVSPYHAEHTLCCLATAPGAIVVGGASHQALDDTMKVFPFSGRGPAPWAGPSATAPLLPETYAPAHDIWGARSKTDDFVQTTGTSAAAALMSGALAARYRNARKITGNCGTRRTGDDAVGATSS
jgi:Subtilase family